MPRRSQNTARGSQTALRKRAFTANLRTLLEHKQRCTALPLFALARLHSVSSTTAHRRWKAYEKARADGRSEEEALDDAVVNRRGGNNRAFTLAQEELLGEIVRTAQPSMTHTQIQAEALRFHTDVVVSTHTGASHATRSNTRFRASDCFVNGFKRRQHLSSHRTAVTHVSRADAGRDMELEKVGFIVEVRDAIDKYGAARVLNMDETPVSLLDVPVTGVVATGSKQAAHIHSTANVSLKFTTFPTISAAGDKLKLCAVLKGKTARCLKKVQVGASADVKRVQLYFSQKGWVNEGIMALYLRDVLLPYTHAEPAALILDSYKAHFTPALCAAAAAMQLQLIQVPAGCTAELQPLDASFNGPLLMKRKQIWADQKLVNPFAADTAQAALERAQQAYAAMPKSLVLKSFRTAYLID